MRLFLAINPPEEVRRETNAATAALRAAAPELSWVAEERTHLTLKFLGEQPDERLDEIQAMLAAVASRHRDLLMTLGGVGAFPNFRRARVVWIGVTPDPRLELLHHDLDVACERLGFAVEGRPFRPHITLARVKDPLAEDRLRELSRTSKATRYRTDFIVRSIDLMKSELTQTGTVYTTLVSAALRSD
ncbi:MAG: RNA 2',3'-cyclic phosphodiesterase [Gemmatimonadaceae bacterium]